ncbi:MAG: hypothetical protein HY722_14030 [Planctomycetes bacterium]|nr:hypothetical protein [Planctomycetota bacterium]
MRPIALLAATLAAVLHVAPALAGGGFAARVRTDREAYVPDEAGEVSLDIALDSSGCHAPALVPVDPRIGGPAITVERLQGETWEGVREASSEAAWERPIPLDHAMRLTASRRLALAAGTYRLAVEAALADDSRRFTYHSPPFEVLAQGLSLRAAGRGWVFPHLIIGWGGNDRLASTLGLGTDKRYADRYPVASIVGPRSLESFEALVRTREFVALTEGALNASEDLRLEPVDLKMNLVAVNREDVVGFLVGTLRVWADGRPGEVVRVREPFRARLAGSD